MSDSRPYMQPAFQSLQTLSESQASGLDDIPFMEYILFMEWTIEFDEEFSTWFESLDKNLQDEITATLKVLAEKYPNCGCKI